MMENSSCIVSLTGDPITYGHRDIIKRAKAIFRFVHILIPETSSKKGALLSYEDRKAAIEQDLWSDGVFNGVDFLVEPIHPGEALVDAARRYPECNVVVRGLRNEQDLIYEMDMGAVNRMLNPDIETLYLPCKPELSFVSSSMVRELVRLGKYETAEKFTSASTMKLLKRAVTKVVALGGGIACGKSTVRYMFSQAGWSVIDCDEINRSKVLSDPDVLNKIKNALEPYGTINVESPAKSIGQIVFACPEAREKLEAIAFPIIEAEVKSWTSDWRKCQSSKILVEMPLLFEPQAKQFNRLFDMSVFVTAQRDKQVERLAEKGYSQTEIEMRLASQSSPDEKAKLADFVIENNGGIFGDLAASVSEVMKKISMR